jgi:hypothetical protein
MEEIKPLLARIQELKSGKGDALSGTQLMAFFLQCRVQPLQHRDCWDDGARKELVPS